MTTKKSKNRSRTPTKPKVLKSVIGRKGTPDPRKKGSPLSDEEDHGDSRLGTDCDIVQETESSPVVLSESEEEAGSPLPTVVADVLPEQEQGPSGTPVVPALVQAEDPPNGEHTSVVALEQPMKKVSAGAGPSGTKSVIDRDRRSRSRRPMSRGRSVGAKGKQTQQWQHKAKPQRKPTTARSISRAAKREHIRSVHASVQLASWAELFKAKAPTPQQALKFVPPTVVDGKECVFMPATVPQQAIKRWEHTLVGYIIGRAVELRGLPGLLKDIWGLRGTVRVMPRGNGFHMFQFSNPAEIDKVMNGGPWFLQGKPLILRRWTPDSPFEYQRLTSIPLWVKFPGLPLKHWTTEGLSTIASALGTPLFVDTPTANLTNIAHARICVEMHCLSTFPSTVNIFNEANGLMEQVQVVYEWKPTPCTHCKTFGHYESSCVPGAIAKAKGKEVVAQQNNQPTRPPPQQLSAHAVSTPSEIPGAPQPLPPLGVPTTVQTGTQVAASPMAVSHEAVTVPHVTQPLPTAVAALSTEVAPLQGLPMTSTAVREMALRQKEEFLSSPRYDTQQPTDVRASGRDASYTVGQVSAAMARPLGGFSTSASLAGPSHVLALPHPGLEHGGLPPSFREDPLVPGLSSFSMRSEEPQCIQTVDGRVLIRTSQGWDYQSVAPRFGAKGTLYDGYQFSRSVCSADFAPRPSYLPSQEEVERKLHLVECSPASANPDSVDQCGSSHGM